MATNTHTMNTTTYTVYGWYGLTSMTPGMQVSVVKEYAADSLCVDVSLLSSVDCRAHTHSEQCTGHKGRGTLPTDGKPMRATRASPDFITSKPSPWMGHLVLV